MAGEETGGETGATAVPGWYDDPLVAGGKRYWDGRRWTEAVHGPNPATPPGASIGGPPTSTWSPESAPPFYPLPPGAHAVGPSMAAGPGGGPSGDKFNDMGEWLGRTFTVIFANPLPVAVLSLLSLPPWGVAILLWHRAVSDIRLTVDSGDLDGFSASTIIAATAMTLVALAASAIGHLAIHHFLYAAHVGRTTSWGRSLMVGLTRQPRFLGLMVLVYLVTYLAIAVPIGLFIYALVQGSGGLLALVALSIGVGLAALAFLIWFWVKAAVFVPVAAAVVPQGTSALMAGWRLSDGRFWPILGRVGIIYALAATTSTVAQIISQSLAPVVLFSKFEFIGDQLFVNGQNLDTISVLRLGDALPNPVGMLIYLGLIAVFTVAAQTVSASATAGLYADGRGPNSFDH